MSQAVYLDPSRRVQHVPVVIANGDSLTGEIPLRSYRLAGIAMPAAWTAANLTFQGAEKTGGTYQDVYDSGGTEVTVTAAAARHIVLTQAQAEALAPLEFIKVRSGTTGTPVTQAAARTVFLILVASTK